MIRPVRLEDAAAIAAIYAPNVDQTVISFEEVAPDAAAMRDRIAKTVVRWPWLVYDAGDAVAAYVYASEHRVRAAYRWAVDVAAYTHERYRGRGIGGALYRALFRLLEVQRFHRAFAGIALPNDASIALHRSVGFEPVGVYREVGFKLGTWHDVSWWARPLGEGPPTGDPVPFCDLDPATVRRALEGG